MTPDEQRCALKRFLKVQPMVGWPEWECPLNQNVRIQIRPEGAGTWCWVTWAKKESQDDWVEIQDSRDHHEALCMIQAHLLSKLAEYTAEQNELVQIHMAHGDVAVPGVNVYGGLGLHGEAPTLIEALLNFFEQIQREQSDEAV